VVRLAKLDNIYEAIRVNRQIEFFSEAGGDREGDDLTTSIGRVKHLFGITAARWTACRQDTSSRNATIHPNEIAQIGGMPV